MRRIASRYCSANLQKNISVMKMDFWHPNPYRKLVVYYKVTHTSHTGSYCKTTYCLLCQRILRILQPQHCGFCRQRTIVIALPHLRFWWFLDFVVSDDWFTCPSETQSPGSKVIIIFERDFALVVTYVSYFRDIK